MRFYFATLVVLLLGCCTAYPKDKPDNAPKEITYCQLARDPAAFSGKQIRVRAIYKYMFEMSRLKSPTCCAERDVPIWVDFDEKLGGNSRKLFRRFPKGMGLVLATFAGRFEGGGPYGDGGYRFKFTVDEIEKLEDRAKPSLNHDPPWIPKNCDTSEGAPSKKIPIYRCHSLGCALLTVQVSQIR
ncbi:MAG TPA: hypothetical protein VMV59_00525 [Candidatus Dormibacteraeota bacterium]|nr:hypothetical protein [Candidatus Dormibacteraeota bacterium]